MAKERRPLSCDIWNRPWPPKHMTGEPLNPGERPTPTRPEPDLGPLPPPTKQNWLALVLGTSSCALVSVYMFLIALAFGPEAFILLTVVAYFVLLTWGAFHVRPLPKPGIVYVVWFTAIHLQLGIHLLFTWRLVAEELEGSGALYMPDNAYLIAAGIAVLSGWIPSLGLYTSARRGGLLLASQTIFPILLLFTMMALAAATSK